MRCYLGLPLLLAALLPACGGGELVVRKRGSIEAEGRWIPPEAYAWYVRAIHEEHNGQLENAAHSYLAALDHDERSGAAWRGLIRTVCRQDSREALDLSRQALEVADRPALVRVARAHCLESQARALNDPAKIRAKLQAALRESLSALDSEPNLNAATAGSVQIFRKLGREKEARRYERGSRLKKGSPRRPGSRQTVDDCLRMNHLNRARTLSAGQFTGGQLASRALALGKPQLALSQAQLVQSASPGDPESAVVLLLLGESISVKIADVSSRSPALSPVVTLLLAFELRRKVGVKAARSVLSTQLEHITSSRDPLVIMLREQSTAHEIKIP